VLARGKHRIASLLVAALLATGLPLATPVAAAADVGATGVITGHLRSVVFTSATTGFAAAENGVIIRTTDGGNRWTQVRPGDTYSFRGIDFWDADNGVAVDYLGKVAHTTDGGLTWTNVDFTPYADMDRDGVSRTHHDVACAPTGDEAITAAGDDSSGDGVWTGATAMRSTGLVSYWWDPLVDTKPHRYYNPADLTFYDEGIGEFLDIEYVTDSTVWASGIDYWLLDANNPAKYPLFKSVDGGVTWTKVGVFGTANLRLEGVAFGSATAGVVVGSLVGSTGRAYYTNNGGSTWPQSTLPGTTALNAVDMTSATQAWAVDANGSIIRTTDGGATWTACTIVGGNTQALYDVTFLPGTTTGWAVGAWGTVLMTTDGSTWYPPDLTAPALSAITSTSHPVATSWYPTRAIAASWSATDVSGVAGYSVVLDQVPTTVPGTTVTQTGATYAATVPSDGVWYLHVRAVDTKGNWTSTTQHRAFRADTAPPETTSDAAGPYLGGGTITLTPTDPAPGSGVAQTYWSLDGGPSGTGTSVGVTTEGDWTLRFHSVDIAGNVENERTDGFAVEIAPTLSAISSVTHPDPDGWYGSGDLEATWTGSDSSGVAGYAVILDQSAATVPTTVSQTGASFAQTVTDGEWYLHVRARDTRGNWSQTEHRRFRVDTGLPTVTAITSTSHPVSETWYATRSLAATWSASDASGIAGYSVVLDQNAGTVPGTTVTQTGAAYAGTLSADGVWYLHVRAVDGTGDWGGTQRRAFRADTAPPETTSDAAGPYAGSATITLTPTDPAPGSGVFETYWSLDGGPSGTGTTVSVTTEGDWTLRFHSVDLAGNAESERTAAFAVEIPPAAPTIASSTHPDQNTAYADGRFSASWTSPDTDVAGYAVVLDGSAATVPAPQVTQAGAAFEATVPADTTRYLHVRAQDARGNWGETSHFTVRVAPVAAVAVAGVDRIATAIEAAKIAFPEGAFTVVIATARNWPDALGGAALAGAVGGPILLTEPGALPTAVATAISALGADKAIILGGTAAVSSAVESSLVALLGAADVDRIEGADRYGTAREVAGETVRRLWPGGYDGTAFVATGANFPDALGGSPLAAANGWPIYLVRPTGVDDALVQSMTSAGVDHMLVLGGTAVVSDSTKAALEIRVVATSKRLAGADRYATARVVATYGVSDAGLAWHGVALATGTNFPDALAGGVLQGRARSVMLLTGPDVLYDGARQALDDNSAVIWEIRFLGGTSAVSQAVRDAALAALR